MISRSRKKRRITAQSIRPHSQLWILPLLWFAASDISPLYAQHSVPSASWSNRQTWSTGGHAATAADRYVIKSTRLSWRPASATGTAVGVPAEYPAADATSAKSKLEAEAEVLRETKQGSQQEFFEEFPPAAFPPAKQAAAARSDEEIRDELVSGYQRRLQTRLNFADCQTVVAEDIQVRSNSSDAPSTVTHWNPFGDQPDSTDVWQSQDVFADDPPSSGSPFSDPFGDKLPNRSQRLVELQPTPAAEEAVLPRPAKFKLSPDEPPVKATPRLFRLVSMQQTQLTEEPLVMKVAETKRPSITKGQSGEGGLQLHDAVAAFSVPLDLQLDTFRDSQSDRSADSDLEEPLLEKVPSFPKTDSGLSEPPTPESVPGNRDLPQLPNLQEPQRREVGPTINEDLEVPGDDRKPSFSELDDEAGDDKSEKADEDAGKKKGAAEDGNEKCDRIYNDRDCCQADEDCQDIYRRLKALSVKDISINIAPPLVPLTEDETDIEEQQERLSDSPSRDWRNRDNTIVATGRLEDYVDDTITIRADDGSTRRIRFYDLSRDDMCFVTAWWRLPNECIVASDDLAIRNFTMMTYTWKASAVCHKPAYFEDVQLERYGHSAGPVLQPFVSGAHFFTNIAMLPYNMGVYPPNECRYVLGYYRPGSCAPWILPAFPLSRRGLAFEALGIFGFTGVF